MHTRNLAVLRDKCVPLSPHVAQHGRSVKVDAAQGLCELGGGVGEEADAALAVGVEVLAPGLHDEGIVDGDDEDVAGRLELLGADVVRDVGFGAAGAWRLKRLEAVAGGVGRDIGRKARDGGGGTY